MSVTPLPFGSPIARFEQQAVLLLAAHAAASPQALEIIHHNHPRFLDDAVPWLPRPLEPSDIARAPFTTDDARLTVARAHSFLDWASLAEHADAVVSGEGPAFRFESAVQAVITGDAAALRASLTEDPSLIGARSTRRTCQEPAVPRATLLHYLAANGVENQNQKSPANAVEIATILLDAGAEVDALADMYSGQYATLSMLISSTPPSDAGVQVPVVELLLDRGAAVEGVGSPQWKSPLVTALVFAFADAAEAVARRGARIDLVGAAGLGRLGDVQRLLSTAGSEERHRALAIAAQLGRLDIVRLLLEAGEDPNRYNPDGFHAHATPLHHAAGAGHLEVVRLLVDRGGRLDVRDTLWQSTPLGWAEHGGQAEAARYLAAREGLPKASSPRRWRRAVRSLWVLGEKLYARTGEYVTPLLCSATSASSIATAAGTFSVVRRWLRARRRGW